MHNSLSNIRVLDLTNVLAGPFCCQQMAHMGADVIKVEVPNTGDLARQLGADPTLNAQKMGISFLAQNSGKRSISINLKSAKGKEILTELVKTADVLVENFRPGVMERLGLGYEALKAINPKLVYCAISGFGADGPMIKQPAYDQIIQGLSGVMSITGTPEDAPYRVGYPICDTIGGITAAFAISSALVGRETTKEGCFIDVSLLESTMVTMGWVVSNYLIGGKEPSPMGNNNFTASPSGTFQTGDGLINLAANKQEQFEAVCEVIERRDLIKNPDFHVREKRLENRKMLTALIEEGFSKNTAEYWEVKLNAAGVPAGRVLTVPEALELEQIKGRDLEIEFENVPNIDRNIKVVKTGFKIDQNRPSVSFRPPLLGEHTNEILAELGYLTADINKMQTEGSI
jgi:formyl-CoA transferase